MIKLSYSNPDTWIKTIWDALETCDFTDEQQERINTAMAWTMEELGVEHEID